MVETREETPAPLLLYGYVIVALADDTCTPPPTIPGRFAQVHEISQKTFRGWIGTVDLFYSVAAQTFDSERASEQSKSALCLVAGILIENVVSEQPQCRYEKFSTVVRVSKKEQQNDCTNCDSRN